MSIPESKTNLRRFDLNLLPILKVLLATHSVARSAMILGLSQSATSGALTRLRHMFGDPLLVQVGRNLVPTTYAEELQPLVEEAFLRMQHLFDSRSFDPLTEERCFVITASDFAIARLSVALIAALRGEAPQMSVRFTEVSPIQRLAVASGEVDFLLAPQNNPISSDEVHSLALVEDEMVILSRPDFNPGADELDLATYLAADHVAYALQDMETFEQWALASQNLKRRVLLTVPQFGHLAPMVAATGCLAMMPRFAAERDPAAKELKFWRPPFAMPPFQFLLQWSDVLDRNPAHRWFRALIQRVWAGEPGGARSG